MHVMKKLTPFWIAACVTAAGLAFASPAENSTSSETIAASLRDKALHGDTVAWDFVSELTTRYGPRPAGSAAELAAARWAEKRAARLSAGT